ncbi:MAG: tRNA (adenosine(37)-N6)-threonylcarbamoyltransferase complex transferase subunit TsaD [bacterium]
MINWESYTILAIETSLDDTCAAVVRGGRVLSNIVNSQTRFHADWGGTVPDIAKRLHHEWLPKVVDLALRKAGISLGTVPKRNSRVQPEKGSTAVEGTVPRGVDAIAVTIGPGLAPSLEQGIAYATEFAHLYNIPLIPVNHMEGHLLSSYVQNKKGTSSFSKTNPQYPSIGFLISGGHTELVLMKGIGNYQLLGETLDDAAGEAYDKVARLLMLGYPGGPILAEMAKNGTPNYHLPEPMTTRKDLNFSFSGLKAAARRYLESEKPELTQEFVQNFAASFQKAVFKHLTTRLLRAIEEYNPSMLLLGGGVVSNIALRKLTREIAKEYGIKAYFPKDKKLITDNAAMIGYVAWEHVKLGDAFTSQKLDRLPNLNFPKL